MFIFHSLVWTFEFQSRVQEAKVTLSFFLICFTDSMLQATWLALVIQIGLRRMKLLRQHVLWFQLSLKVEPLVLAKLLLMNLPSGFSLFPLHYIKFYLLYRNSSNSFLLFWFLLSSVSVEKPSITSLPQILLLMIVFLVALPVELLLPLQLALWILR